MAGYSSLFNQELRQTYSTFSPTDIVIFMAGIEIGSATGLRFTIARNKVPHYTFGHVNPKAISRGTRIVTGTFNEFVVNSDSVRNSMRDFFKNSEIYRPEADKLREWLGKAHNSLKTTEEFEGALRAKFSGVIFLDELYPIDMVAVGVDEMGNMARIILNGCEFLDEGFSVNMTQSETIIGECNFIARDAHPMCKIVPTE